MDCVRRRDSGCNSRWGGADESQPEPRGGGLAARLFPARMTTRCVARPAVRDSDGIPSGMDMGRDVPPARSESLVTGGYR
jgi:hypothetical protein